MIGQIRSVQRKSLDSAEVRACHRGVFGQCNCWQMRAHVVLASVLSTCHTHCVLKAEWVVVDLQDRKSVV